MDWHPPSSAIEAGRSKVMDAEAVTHVEPDKRVVVAASAEWRTILLPILVFLIAAATMLAIFFEGQRRGLDHWMMFGPEGDQNAMAVALSESVYATRRRTRSGESRAGAARRR